MQELVRAHLLLGLLPPFVLLHATLAAVAVTEAFPPGLAFLTTFIPQVITPGKIPSLRLVLAFIVTLSFTLLIMQVLGKEQEHRGS